MARDLEAYLRTEAKTTPFCPGCGHGILMNQILRAVDASGIPMEEMLFVSGIGCAAWIPSPHFKGDTLHTLHGRAIPFATGAKLFNPALHTLVISGDGDLTSIGGNHLIHAARRDTDLTVICANNQIYGMTGGQAASTSPQGILTSTTNTGNPHRPFDLCALVSAAGASYVARYAVTQPMALMGGIRRALAMEGFRFLEVLSPCPTQFGRRNRFESPAHMLRTLMERCVMREDAQDMSEEELEGKIVTGEFVCGEKP